MKKQIQVFILSYNRSSYLREALNSVLSQTFISMIDVMVSDNSTNDDVQRMMNTEYPAIRYVMRKPSLPPDQHFKVVIGEVTSQYYMIFHDDDIMLPNMVESLYIMISNKPTVVAVGANSLQLHDNRVIQNKMILFNNVIFKNGKQFVKRYLTGLGVCPFPSYMYRSSVYTMDFINKNNGGKYFDVSFLLNGCKYGNIMWNKHYLMYSRTHQSNDSGVWVVEDIDKLIDFIIINTGIKRNSYYIKIYKMHQYYQILSDNIKSYLKRIINGGSKENEVDHQLIKSAFKYHLLCIDVFVFMKIPLILYARLMRIYMGMIRVNRL